MTMPSDFEIRIAVSAMMAHDPVVIGMMTYGERCELAIAVLSACEVAREKEALAADAIEVEMPPIGDSRPHT
jgi:hypothetical protein